MDAKKELLERLVALNLGKEAEIEEILAGYAITKGHSKMKCNLQKRIASFLAAKKIDGLSPKTLKSYRDNLNAFARRVDKHVSSINADDIREYIGYLSDRGLADSTLQLHVNILRSFFAWMNLEDIIKKNPMLKIKSLKVDKLRARRPLTAEQLERLRDECQTYKEKALVEFMVSSGCRLSEVIGIQVEQVNWHERSVVVLGKGNKERTVYFSVRAKVMLQAYLEQRRGGEALFASSRAPYGPMQDRAVQKILKSLGERAAIPRRVHPHILRHTFASNAINAGMDITIIQQLLGHADPKTTLIYAELSPRMVRYEYEKLVS